VPATFLQPAAAAVRRATQASAAAFAADMQAAAPPAPQVAQAP
jgi:hypothetical protein